MSLELKNSVEVPNDHKISLRTTAQFHNKSKLQRKSYSYQHLRMGKPIPDWNISSATLRHSPRKFAFSRDMRFKDPKIAYYDHAKLQYPSSLGNRSTNFGVGNKVKIPQIFSNKIGTETVNCPFYIDVIPKRASSSVSLQKGKTFGLPWSAYLKSRTPHRHDVHSYDQVKASPGPQHYDAINSGKYPSMRGKMHERLKMFSNIIAEAKRTDPSPQKYQIKQDLVKASSRQTTGGFGQKTDFTKYKRDVPGPIYKISGFCDKYTHTKKKNIGLNQ